MQANPILNYIKNVLEQMPNDWVSLTTHRLDIYNEDLAKQQFLTEFEALYEKNNANNEALSQLPTAYDYIRLGHPLSSVLEWAIAKLNHLPAECIISFSSVTMPILAVLRKNKFEGKHTQILFLGTPPNQFDSEIIQQIYDYQFETKQVNSVSEISSFEGSTILVSDQIDISQIPNNSNIDFFVHLYDQLGSIISVLGKQNAPYVSEIQHVRRRETIAMTPANTGIALQQLVGLHPDISDLTKQASLEQNKASAIQEIKTITGSQVEALIASSGLSMQYAIMMGVLHYAHIHHSGKAIKLVVPPNCYGGTNDQARRVAATLDHVEIVDLAVDGEDDMVQNIDKLLTKIALEDAVPFIIAEIPTNPRVEVPDLKKLEEGLSKRRITPSGNPAIDPVFILDQTFCPNVHFLGEQDILSSVRTISYVSGSKFPSGGKCTAGYCVTNESAEPLMEHIGLHLNLCDNQATALQLEILAQQLPSMNKRIQSAYQNTNQFVQFIQESLPDANINFVSEELAENGFTPSVFSLDLPTKGNTEEERETYKRALNLKLINLMISKIPHESKYCVSYGQLNGSYWTIPATSTQGTTKEGDKDYIIRASLSPNLDLELHQSVFKEFVSSILD